jgi:lactoylglutathione lyase
MSAYFKRAAPYADDALNLPVADVDAAIPFYEERMGFRVESRQDSPVRSAILTRDDVRIGLAENGGDPEQEGCFFEVSGIEDAFTQAHGVAPKAGEIQTQDVRGTMCRVFFVIAPDKLCYMLAEPL